MILPDFFRTILTKFNRIYVSIFLAQILFWLGGTAISWTSPTVPKLLNETTSPVGRAITIQETSWISSLITVGGLIGPFLFGYLAKKFGKRRTLVIVGLPYLASSVIVAFAKIIELFFVARFLTGLAMGGTFTITTNYAIELSNKYNRGVIGSLSGITVSLGMLFTYCLGPYLDITIFNLVLAAVAGTFVVTFFLIAAECPIYHLNKNNEEKAKVVIEMKQGVFTKADIELELEQIKSDLNQGEEGDMFQLFKSSSLTKLFFISVSLFIIQQLCGGIFIQYYSQSIFEMTGASFSAEICAMIVGATQLLSALVTPFILDKFGRKKMLVTSCLGMFLTHTPLGVYIYLTEQGIDTSSFSFLPVVALALNVMAYNIGAGPLPWLIPAELFPQRVKISATSLVASCNWILSFLMSYSYGFFIFNIGLTITFLLFGICCFVFAFYCYIFVPETRGKTLEELHIDLTKK